MMPANVMMEFAFTIIFSLVSVVGMLLVVVARSFSISILSLYLIVLYLIVLFLESFWWELVVVVLLLGELILD